MRIVSHNPKRIVEHKHGMPAGLSQLNTLVSYIVFRSSNAVG